MKTARKNYEPPGKGFVESVKLTRNGSQPSLARIMNLVVKDCGTFNKRFVGPVELTRRRCKPSLARVMNLEVKDCETFYKGFVSQTETTRN